MRVLIFYLNIITQLGEDSQPDGVRYRKFIQDEEKRVVKKFNHKVTAAMMSAILMASTLVGCGQTAECVFWVADSKDRKCRHIIS